MGIAGSFCVRTQVSEEKKKKERGRGRRENVGGYTNSGR